MKRPSTPTLLRKCCKSIALLLLTFLISGNINAQCVASIATYAEPAYTCASATNTSSTLNSTSGGKQTYTLNNTNGVDYQVSVGANTNGCTGAYTIGTVSGPSFTAGATVTFTGTGTAAVINILNAGGCNWCSGNTSATLTYTHIAYTNATSTATICNAGTKTLSITPTPLAAGSWSVAAGSVGNGTFSGLTAGGGTFTASTAGAITLNWTKGGCVYPVSFTINGLPTITSQPSSGAQTTCAGGTAFTALSVTATGAGLTYQWYSNTTASNSGGTLITGATSSSYTPSNAAAGVLYYYVIVSGTCTPAVTSTVSGAFTVNALPAITGQPSSGTQTTCAGGTAFTALSVTATGAGLTYQWYSNTTASNSGGTLITGATSSSYTPPNATAGVLYYYVIVSGTCTPAVTSTVTGAFTVNALPAITGQPSSGTQTTCAGGTAFTALSVTATGAGLTYQWYKNASASNSGGTLLAGATSSTYTPSNATPGVLYYYVIVSGTCAPAVTSTVSGAFTVNSLPTITTQPSSGAQTTCAGGTAFTALSVAATGTGATYQWYSNTTSSTVGGTFLTGATSTSYTPPNATAGVLYYYVIVSGTCTPAATSTVSGAFTVNGLPAITTQPSAGSQTTCQSGTAFTALSVIATGAGLTYQWYKNATASNSGGTLIGGATSSTYTPSNATVGVLYYYVIVSGTCAPAVTSSVSGSFTVNALPAITTQPSTGTQTTCAGGTAFTAISVGATGAGLTYQWYSNTTASNSGGTLISGATSSSYTPSNASAGVLYYYVIVSGTCAPTATSNVTGAFTVNAIPTPTFTATPSSPLCNYTNATYTTQSGQSSYIWSGFGTAGVDYTIISGGLSSTDNTVTLQWISTGTKAVTVSYSSSGCPAASPASNSIVVNARPVPSVSTSGSACTGSTITYTTQSGQSSYVWTIPGTAGTDYTLISGGGSTNNTLVLAWITSGSKTVTVNYNNASGCTGTSAGSSTITVANAPTSATIASTIDPCNGGYASLITFTGGTSPYTFQLTPPGSYYTLPSGSTVDGQGATTITVSNISDANGCPVGSVSGNPVTLGTRALTTGNTQACTVAASSTKVFFDGSANLMAKITAGSTALGSTTVVTTVDGSVGHFGPTNMQSYLQRHFKITPTTSAPATICLYMSDAEVAALNSASAGDNHSAPSYYQTFSTSMSNANITKYHGGTEAPGDPASTRSVITSITATHNPSVDGSTFSSVWELCFNINSFSGFYIHSANVNGDPLPVTLVNFTANAIDNKFVELNWLTATELDNSGFQIERSSDGASFNAIGWVEGHGTSSASHEYKFSDMTAIPGITYYYRLKQIDIDGRYAYSPIASAALTGGKGFSLESLVPNPASNQVSIGVISNVDANATVTLTDMLGRVVFHNEWPMSVGYNVNQFDLNTVPTGTYLVTIFSNDIKTTKKLVITR